MRYILLICFLLPCTLMAQTRADHEHAMARFVKYYNHNKGKRIIKMWPAEEWHEKYMASMWGKKPIKSYQKEYGKITSYKYLGIDTEDANPNLAVFETRFSITGWKTTSLTLDSSGHLETFRLITSSDGIDKLLKEKKK